MEKIKKRGKVSIVFPIVGIFFILSSISLTLVNYKNYSKKSCLFPDGSSLAGVDISGLDATQALAELRNVYEQPVTIQIGGLFFDLTNEQAGLSIQYDEMLSALNCDQNNNFIDFWSFIWNRNDIQPIHGDLKYSFELQATKDFIDQNIDPYVIKTPVEPSLIQGTTRFKGGVPGISYNRDTLLTEIKKQIVNPKKEVIHILLEEIPAPSPTVQQIQEQIITNLQKENFQGGVEIFAQKMSDHETINLLYWFGELKEPGVAYTAASTMKIPIMLSTYWHQDLPLPEIMDTWLNHMIILSENDPADRLMEQIDFVRGPLLVTNDVQSLGLNNTFIAGYFYLGAPLLNLYETPANQRTDVFTDPDIYNQTTAEDIGRLLEMIYACGNESSSYLYQISQGKLNQEKCNLIINTLARNKMGALIEAGLPEGLKIAHKHGWSSEKDGLIHSFSDVAIVFAPENDFVLTVFTYSPNQLLFDVANPLIARISQIIYNGFNPNNQIAWPFPE